MIHHPAVVQAVNAARLRDLRADAENQRRIRLIDCVNAPSRRGLRRLRLPVLLQRRWSAQPCPDSVK
jgi:hypothetical protein